MQSVTLHNRKKTSCVPLSLFLFITFCSGLCILWSNVYCSLVFIPLCSLSFLFTLLMLCMTSKREINFLLSQFAWLTDGWPPETKKQTQAHLKTPWELEMRRERKNVSYYCWRKVRRRFHSPKADTTQYTGVNTNFTIPLMLSLICLL